MAVFDGDDSGRAICFSAQASNQDRSHYPMPIRNVLFVCSRNRLRSPTAEQVFASWPGIDCSSAGLNHDAENPLTAELVEWADLLFVMERAQRDRLATRFKRQLTSTRVVCLDIPDNYTFMQPELVDLLRRKVTPFL